MSDFVLVKVSTEASATYSLDEAAELADVCPELLRYYCRSGLLGIEHTEVKLGDVFDDTSLYQVRRIEHYRRHHGVNLRALPLFFDLLREIESLGHELRAQRSW